MADYTDIIGGFFPDPTSRDWLTQYRKLLEYRLNECPVDRPITLYISQGGSGISGWGYTPDNPIVVGTAANLATFITGWIIGTGLPVNFRLQRGDLFGCSTTGIYITSGNVTISDYGDSSLHNPRITASVPYSLCAVSPVNTWTAHPSYAGSGVFWITVSTGVFGVPNWVLFGDTQESPYFFSKTSNADSVSYAPGRFYVATGHASGTVVYAKFFNNTGTVFDDNLDPKVRFAVGLTDGIHIDNAHNVRLENLNIDCWGVGAASNQGWGIKATINGTGNARQAVVVNNCEVYLTGSHAIGKLSNSNGGSLTVTNSRFGACRHFQNNNPDSGNGGVNMTAGVSFSNDGYQESIWDRYTIDYGALRDVVVSGNVGQALYNHTAGSPASGAALFIAMSGFVAGGTSYGINTPTTVNRCAVFNRNDLYRANGFVMSEEFEGGDGSNTSVTTADLGDSTNGRCVFVNCSYNFGILDFDQMFNSVDGVRGFFYNCKFNFDTRYTTRTVVGWQSSTQTDDHEYDFVNCRFDFVLASGQSWRWDLKNHNLTTNNFLNTRMYNCIQTSINASGLFPSTTADIGLVTGVPNAVSGGMANNAYYGVNTGRTAYYTSTQSPMVLSSFPTDGPILESNPLAKNGTRILPIKYNGQNLALAFDFDNNDRQGYNISIGPYDFTGVTQMPILNNPKSASLAANIGRTVIKTGQTYDVDAIKPSGSERVFDLTSNSQLLNPSTGRSWAMGSGTPINGDGTVIFNEAVAGGSLRDVTLTNIGPGQVYVGVNSTGLIVGSGAHLLGVGGSYASTDNDITYIWAKTVTGTGTIQGYGTYNRNYEAI